MIEGLGHLLVIDRLDVGPVELEDDKLTMPYAVTRMEDGAEITDATELIYKFQEPVFTKREDGTWDPHDVNLASLIGAQVALNYGLFAKEIRFRGPFDKNDRGFLRDMAANTAREIYVKKILEPNPFLTLAKHPTVRTRTYVQAELTFEGDDEVPPTTPWVRPESERAIAVLSSGGKDSLLSTGLLEEIGQEVHPLFVNESGRHWFTAINGFRLMEDRHPDRTARVWTNSDRVFPWMLKHLPFVRTDHQRLRSDEYPIRLWTVAVFLFGVLPLMKKRGLDRLVIGDEFDTTVRARTEGIPHWNGLFDQSRIFDATLTRFFHKKGWKVHQFSILRPMSELLIQRTLMKRYPDLFAAQMSCHATHTEGDRVRPCGRCEKCRRIVGMVLSEGGDPEACGYTPGQIEPALSDLAKQGAHQEKDGQRHLAWSLLRKGLISRESPLAKIAKQMPHVVRLRFDSQVSPIADIPQDLRAPLYRIMLEHAEGAVRAEGRSWESFDLLAPNALAAPSAFARALQEQDDQIPPDRPTHRLAELTWPQARRRLSEVDVAILPVGAVEQHGKHLPLDVDIWDVVYQADEVAKRCSEPRPLVFPGIPYGVSYHHDDFAGTISVSPETLSRVIYEIGMSAARNGIRKLVILNGHGGNVPALQFAAQMINRDAHIFTCVDSGETSDNELQDVIETNNDVHAGELETSTTLAMRPELVYMDRAETHVPRFSSRYLDFGSNVSVSWFTRTSRISPSGVMGDPTKATPEKGRRAWEITIANMVELVEHLKTTSLEEIYRRRE